MRKRNLVGVLVLGLLLVAVGWSAFARWVGIHSDVGIAVGYVYGLFALAMWFKLAE